MLKDLDIKTVKMGILFASCSIILHNFLEINMDTWEINSDDETDDENDQYISRQNRENYDVLKRIGQAKRDLIIRQHFM